MSFFRVPELGPVSPPLSKNHAKGQLGLKHGSVRAFRTPGPARYNTITSTHRSKIVRRDKLSGVVICRTKLPISIYYETEACKVLPLVTSTYDL